MMNEGTRMKTFKDLDKDDRGREGDRIDAIANAMGMDEYSKVPADAGTVRRFSAYGRACPVCQSFQFAEARYRGVVIANCSYHECRLSANDPVERCSGFVRRGTMSLNEMKEMALLIEPAKDKLGF